MPSNARTPRAFSIRSTARFFGGLHASILFSSWWRGMLPRSGCYPAVPVISSNAFAAAPDALTIIFLSLRRALSQDWI